MQLAHTQDVIDGSNCGLQQYGKVPYIQVQCNMYIHVLHVNQQLSAIWHHHVRVRGKHDGTVAVTLFFSVCLWFWPQLAAIKLGFGVSCGWLAFEAHHSSSMA